MVRDLVRPVLQEDREEHRLVQQPAHQRVQAGRGAQDRERVVRLRRRDAETCRGHQERKDDERKRKFSFFNNSNNHTNNGVTFRQTL